jgi:hypothetical protein
MPAHSRIRIVNGGDHLADAGAKDRLRARRGPPGVTARFKCYIKGCATRPLARSIQGYHFGMRPSELRVVTLPHDDPIPHEDRADQGVRARAPAPSQGKFERPPHHFY